MPSRTQGYAGKPLFQKLGLKPGMSCLNIKAPGHYAHLVAGAKNVRFLERAAPSDAVHVFCRRRADVAPLFERALGSVKPGGMIWMSWPKKAHLSVST